MNEFDNSHALLIGIGADDIPFSANDARAIYDVLIDPNIAGYPPENVTLLTKENATKETIMSAFDELSSRINNESNVLLYYSGHGRRVAGKNTNFGKEDYFLEPFGMNMANYDTEGIMAKDLKAKINALAAEQLVFFFDCCHAQGLTKGDDLLGTTEKIDTLLADEKIKQADSEQMVQAIDDEEGMAIISSCKDHEKSLCWENEDISLFTTCLLEVLKGEHEEEFDDPYIRIMDVVSHLLEEVPKRARSGGFSQTPFVNFQSDTNFELSKVPLFKMDTFNNHIFTDFSDKNEVIRVLKTYKNDIKTLEPNYDKLDERGLIKLAEALEVFGRADDAIGYLKNREQSHNDADLLRVIGNLHKSKYLDKHIADDGLEAIRYYSKARKIAGKENNSEDYFLSSINLAFLKLIIKEDIKGMKKMAKKALKATQKSDFDTLGKIATKAEAHLYLGNFDKAKKHYLVAAGKADVKDKLSIYRNAYHAYSFLMDTENDEFISFLKTNFLG